ncbi:hypothetical protein sos41_39330 [Alphaproteobacteria bacterium SO-S41]|nr:hypothetical protein sos41_39330 [Alphaproteobacteria bacterium SO-S41]
MSAVESDLRAFIAENFMYGGDAAALPTDRSLIDEGLIDSTGVLELVSFLEEKFGLVIGDEEIVPANLDSIAAIVAFVDGKHARVAA